MTTASKKIGEPCPNCGKPLIRVPRGFFWRGFSQDGAVCESCNALWPITDEKIEPLRRNKG